MLKMQGIRNVFIHKLCRNEIEEDKLGGQVLEIVGASFLANEDTLFGKANPEYIKAEIEWYESLSLNVNDLFEIYGKEVAIWKSVADRDGFINSNYGWCIYDRANGFQYQMCMNELRNNPTHVELLCFTLGLPCS